MESLSSEKNLNRNIYYTRIAKKGNEMEVVGN